MQYWLIKSEPETWSWDQQVAKGKTGEPWTGVRNFTARQNLKEMKKGDRCFFYHSGKEKAIVAICEPPPTAGNCNIEPAMLAPIKIRSCETGISRASTP